MKQPAVFLDRDGTLMEDVGYIADPAHVRLYPGVSEALRRLKEAGFRLVIVTNQSGIGRGYLTVEQYESVHARLVELLEPGLLDATYFCPEHPDTATERRKPGAGMLREAAAEHGLDLSRSWMIGDREGDLLAGRAAGARAVLVLTGIGAESAQENAHFVAKDLADAVDFILRDSGAS